MIKQVKLVITNYFFLLIFILSILLLVINYFTYSNSISSNHESLYNITYSENISDYDIEITNLRRIIDSMDKKTVDYEKTKKYLEDEILIYEELKKNNIDYSMIYDQNGSKTNDRINYIYLSHSFLFLIVTLNIICVIYIAFTNEFDNSRFTFVYGHKRKKIVFTKIFSSFLIVNLFFLIYYLLNIVISFKFNDVNAFVLLVSDRAYFLDVFKYILFDFIYILYNLWFIFAFVWAISLFAKKTLYSLTIIIVIIGLLAIIPISQNLFAYVGLALNFEIVPFSLIWISRISIFIPISLMFIGTIYFDKSDL